MLWNIILEGETMFTLKNAELEIEISTHGAELKRVVKNAVDYLWNGDPAFWGRTSPVLFPIVGSVAKGKYFVDGEVFELPQHGFARDMDFELESHEDNEIWFKLLATDETRKKYPFEFELRIGYELVGNTVVVKWEVLNNGDKLMPFSIGAHPAFMAEPELDDYSLQIMGSNKGIATRLLDKGRGHVEIVDEEVEIINGLPFLPLNKDFFIEHPTLVLENENDILLRSYSHDREVEVSFAGFPYVGIWAPINEAGNVAPFVCIEPWYGIADTTAEPGELVDKVGIQTLASKEKFIASYSMTFR